MILSLDSILSYNELIQLPTQKLSTNIKKYQNLKNPKSIFPIAITIILFSAFTNLLTPSLPPPSFSITFKPQIHLNINGNTEVHSGILANNDDILINSELHKKKR